MKTYKGTLETSEGKTITVECDRPYGNRLDEASATIRAMFERLCDQRSWVALWDSLKIEELDLRVRA